MAQSFKYPMWSPHKKARHYKRYCGEVELDVKNRETLTVQNNVYVFTGTLTWVEDTPSETSDDQPTDGLIVQNNYLAIRTNSLTKFNTGDLISLPDDSRYRGLWIIGDGARTEYAFTPKQIQTYQYLQLMGTG